MNNEFENEMPDFSSLPEEEEENSYLSPEEYEELKRKNDLGILDSSNIESSGLETEVTIEEAVRLAKEAGESEDYSGLKVEFESEGRFTLPDTLWIGNYKTSDIQEIGLSRDEDIVINLVKALDRRVKNKNFPSFKEACIEEFYEVLINMKAQYDTTEHYIHYMHNCQNGKPDNEKKASKFKVDLAKLKYRSVSEAEEEIRKQFKSVFDTMSDDEFINEYVIPKYGKEVETSKEAELKKIVIKEPFKFNLQNGQVLEMRLGRVKDLILGIQISTRMFSPKIRKIKNTYKANMKAEDLEEWRRVEIEKLELDKVRKAIEITKSQTLLTVNGKPFINEEQKINFYKDIDMKDTRNIDSYLDLIAFGLHDEREVTCEHCGVSERRSLHLEISPLEFLPIKDNKRDSSVNKISRHTISNFHFAG